MKVNNPIITSDKVHELITKNKLVKLHTEFFTILRNNNYKCGNIRKYINGLKPIQLIKLYNELKQL